MSNGTRPNPISHLFHDRAVRLAIGLALVVAIPMAVLFYFQFRSLSDLETTSAVVLHQLSIHTADSMTESLEEYLKRPYINALLRLPQARSEPLDFDWIDPVLENSLAESPFVEAYYLWSEREPGGKGILAYDRASVAQATDSPERRFHENPVLGPHLLKRLRIIAKTRMSIVAFTDEMAGRTYYVQAQLRWEGPARDRMTSVVAIVVDAAKLRSEHVPTLLRERMTHVQQPTGFPPLEVEILDEDGAHVFMSSAHQTEKPVDQREFPMIFFDKELLQFAAPYEQHREIWRLRTGFGPLTIPEVVSASTRPQLALMTVLAIAMALGVFLVAGAAAREVRVAELKSNFVASVSHDLKTPLALIQLFAETLELGRVRNTERAQEYYRIINGEAKKLTRLIENLLDFSRMEAGLRPYRLEPEDLGGVVRRVLSRMENQFAQGPLRVTTHVEPDLPLVLADAGAAEQAVENLLANAVKYSGESRDIELDVSRGGGHLVVAVRDHGIGIPLKEQRRIFRKFYRIQHELSGGPQGTGHGLAIVDHTMRGHGGFVGVTSEPDRGSTFTLHFPIPAQAGGDEVFDETHSRDRGRTADAARPA